MQINQKYLILLLACTVLPLAGCAKVGAGAQRVGNNLHAESLKMDRKVRGWFDSEGLGQADPNAAKKPSTAYCYKSWAQTTCYPYPLEGEDARLAGKQVPAVQTYERDEAYISSAPLPVDSMDPVTPIGVKPLAAPPPTSAATPAPPSSTPSTPKDISPQVF